MKIRPLQAEDWEWIELRASPVLCQDTQGFVAEQQGELVAAVVFDSFSRNSCLSHVVVESPWAIRAGLLYYAFYYVYELKGLGLTTGLTPANNKEALRFAKKVGYREVYRIPDGYDAGVDYVLQEMRRDECRWLHQNIKRAA